MSGQPATTRPEARTIAPPASRQAFADLRIARRAGKPRETGLTMMIDWGLPVATQRGILDIAGAYVDIAKVAVGLSALIAEAVLGEKLKHYETADVAAFPGGMLLELALAQGMLDDYLAATVRLGYPLVEVSDNVVKLSRKRKTDAIRAASAEHGLRVLGEVGSKHVKSDTGELIRDAADCLDAGAWKVLIEAAEFFESGHFDDELAVEFSRALPITELLFELPGVWIQGIQTHQIHATMCWLIERFGPDVNIGNVAADSVLTLETLRTGTGVTMDFESARAAIALTPAAQHQGSRV